jgi:hypothetical protein
MSIRRQYSLPNCTLILEGLASTSSPTLNGRPLLGIVVNAECHFSGIPQKLQGGRTFLENLVNAVGAYAQVCLSGVPHPPLPQADEDQIRLEPTEDHRNHRLTWIPATGGQSQPVEIRLTTVQLFDLIEAVDQFLVDQQTLPDLSLSLQPSPRRFRPPDEPLAQRVIPATRGVASLALVAMALFWLPLPTVRKPEPKPIPQTNKTVPNTANPPTSAPPPVPPSR